MYAASSHASSMYHSAAAPPPRNALHHKVRAPVNVSPAQAMEQRRARIAKLQAQAELDQKAAAWATATERRRLEQQLSFMGVETRKEWPRECEEKQPVDFQMRAFLIAEAKRVAVRAEVARDERARRARALAPHRATDAIHK